MLLAAQNIKKQSVLNNWDIASKKDTTKHIHVAGALMLTVNSIIYDFTQKVYAANFLINPNIIRFSYSSLHFY